LGAKESEVNARKLLGDEVYDNITSKTSVQGGLGHKLYEDWRVISDKDSVEAKAIAEKSREYYDIVRNVNAD
jgi:hypothetical protein